MDLERERDAVRRFYRVVKTDPPTERDFMSYAALGKIPRPGSSAAILRSWQGVSVWETEAQARAVARQFPRSGGFVAALEIAVGSATRSERSGKQEGHCDLFGAPRELLASVVAVVAV